MKKFLVLLFVFCLGVSAFAQDYQIYKMESGQTVIIKQVKNNPIVTIDTWIKTGSINENDKNNGVSHFLEHLFFKGTKNHPTGEMDRLLESKGAVQNAATSKDFTHYYITIPSKYFDLALDLHSDMLLNPLIPRKELEKERKVVMEEIAKDENDPSNKVYENLIQMLYTTHPYKRKVLGTNDVIGKITREEILNYYKQYYNPQNMVTMVIGDVEPEDVLKKISQEFKQKEVKKSSKISNKKEKQLCQKIVKVDYQPVQSGYMLIGYRAADAMNLDSYALDLLGIILGDGRSSILYQSIKEQKQLAYSIAAENSTFKEDGIFMISANFTADNCEKLQRAVFDEILKIQKNGVTSEELSKAKSALEIETYYARESISNIASSIGYTTVLTDNPKYYEEYLENIKKVSLADIKRVANIYLGENQCAVSIVLPEQEEQAKAQAAKTEHNIKMINQTSGVQKYEIDTGAILLITPNDLNDIVAISIYCKGGGFVEKIKGTAFLTSVVMLKGTKNYSSLELAKIMEENGIKIQPNPTTDSFTINVLTTKPKLQKTLEILDEVVNRASFDDYEIEKTKTAKLNSIKQSRDVPLNVALEEYKTLIYENSPYSTSPKILEKNLPKIQREDILQYYSQVFNPKNIVISVNGKAELSDVANQLGDIFGTKAGEKFSYESYTSKIPPISGTKTSTKNIKDLQTAWLVIGWQTSGLQNQKDYVTLQVIDAILGSGMSSRLFKNLREQEGLAYQLGSSYSPNVLRGTFTMFIGTNPKTLALSQKMLLAEINKLKTQFVGDKELSEAKEKIIGNYLLSLETNSEKASNIGWFEASGRGFEFKDKYESLINSVSASDIVEVANKYFNQDYVVSVVNSN